ncbi:MAG TPA: alanine racemase [Candidatus Limnocylindrales bacterium]
MWQAEVAVDLDAIRANVDQLARSTPAEVMAVVKADGYGHGAVESARAALAGGATWLGVCTLEEAAQLREAGLTAPILAWLWMPGQHLDTTIEQDVQLGVSSQAQLAAVVAAAKRTGLGVGTHLKIDTGLSRGGATASDWLALLDRAAKAQADGAVEVVGVWSHLANADEPTHVSVDQQLEAFGEALAAAKRYGIEPRVRHLANSAALLTRPDTHFDLVRAGIAVYGLTPIEGVDFGLRRAMTARAKVIYAKRLPEGAGVSYGHTYVTRQPSTVAVIPFGYADGVPRHASGTGPVQINGVRYHIAGRVCMDQFVVDVGDADVREGDEAILFGSGDGGEPTADDWASAVGTINYEIVTRIGSSRIPRTHHGDL